MALLSLGNTLKIFSTSSKSRMLTYINKNRCEVYTRHLLKRVGSAPETRGQCPPAGKGLGSPISAGGAGDIWPAARPTCWGSAWLQSCAGSISVWRDPAKGRSAWPARPSSATRPSPGTPCSLCSASPVYDHSILVRGQI